ncbi:MAG: hypothetical protein KDD54_04215 [Flavobacteriales bacterium]|nr:hypothetical protein [Flavobacteriales bacterium]
MSMDIQHDCLCQECLHKVIREKTENYAQAFLAGLTDGKAAKKLGPATAPMEGIDYHKDDAGRYVFTAWFHLRRGKCCGNKCRHCPYNHINVPA